MKAPLRDRKALIGVLDRSGILGHSELGTMCDHASRKPPGWKVELGGRSFRLGCAVKRMSGPHARSPFTTSAPIASASFCPSPVLAGLIPPISSSGPLIYRRLSSVMTELKSSNARITPSRAFYRLGQPFPMPDARRTPRGRPASYIKFRTCIRP